MDYTEIKIWLKNNLSEEKYYHSLETANNALKIAKIINYDNPDKAYLAALVHDCAKCMPKDETEKISKTLDYVTKEELSMPKTLHAVVGVEVAKKEFNITDTEILSAIRFHTVAHAQMTPLEMIVFLSDKIRQEFGSKYFGEDAFEFIEKQGIKPAMKKAINNGLEYLKKQNAIPCPLTYDALNWLEENI